MATNMKSLNGYGFDASALGGKAPAYYLQPRNLLDNSDFSNPVNQRGQSSYDGMVYGIDRWKGRVVYQTVSVRTTDITITATGTSYSGIIQKVENMSKLAGKTITFAARVWSNVVPNIRITDASENTLASVDGTAQTTQTLIFTYTVPSDATADSVIPVILLRTTASGDYMRIYWAAMYEGSYTADTLPPYVPKGYAQELAECQRYYYQSFPGSSATVTSGMIVCEAITTYKATNVFFPQTMRIYKPTVTVYSPFTGNVGKATEYVSETEVVADAGHRSGNRFMLQNNASTFEIGKHYCIHYTASADL